MREKKTQNISTGTFWYWNATPTPAGIKRQLKYIADAGFSCVYIHPMPDSFHKHNFFAGMKCKYLGKKYFRLMHIALEECKRLGLYLMLYDEGGWPSGGVLDTLVAKYPDCKTVVWEKAQDGTVGKVVRDVPDQFRPEPVTRFIEMTHELYKKEFGHEFGKTIRGIFTDEPFLTFFTWGMRFNVNDNIVSELKKRYGLDFESEVLPCLWTGQGNDGDGLQKRLAYFDACSRVFAKSYSEQIAQWCKANNLELEGHFSGEDQYLMSGMTGNLLRVLSPLHVPGVDSIWRQIYPTDPYDYFPRFASSAAIRMNRRQTLCEAFNVYTYSLTPRAMNFVANALLIQGINRILPMPYLYEDKGKHKICCSTDISHRVPIFDALPVFNSFWKTAGNFDAGALKPSVWFFTQTPYPGYEDGTERMDNMKSCNRRIQSYADMLDFNGVFWRFADEDDANSKHLPKLLIITHPEILRPDQKKIVDVWKSKGVKVVTSPEEADLRQYSCVELSGGNVCRLFPCRRPEGDALMVFNSSEDDTEFSFKSDKDYSLLTSGNTDAVYPLKTEGNKYTLFMPRHSLRILLEKPSTVKVSEFDCGKLELKWKITQVENMRFSLEKPSCFEKRSVDLELPASGNYCELEKDFSGRLTLKSSYDSAEACSVYIEFEQIDHFASLKVNGVDCGSAAFAPYIFKVDLKKGRNNFELKVSSSAGNEFRRCFREELEPAGYFNVYAKRFTLYPVDDNTCGVSNNIKIFKERV